MRLIAAVQHTLDIETLNAKDNAIKSCVSAGIDSVYVPASTHALMELSLNVTVRMSRLCCTTVIDRNVTPPSLASQNQAIDRHLHMSPVILGHASTYRTSSGIRRSPPTICHL